MKSLYQEYQPQSIHFEAVVAKSFSQEEIDEFKATYQIPFDVRMDSILQYRYNATVTPEVILLDEDGNVLYRGRIDDSYASIGKRRARTKHHELKDALKAVLKGDSIVVKETTPVGCIIQK